MRLLIPFLAVIMLVASSLKGDASETSFLSKNVNLVGLSGPYLVVKSNVNVRAAPQSKAKRITKLESRDIVTVLGRVDQKKWFAVKRNGEDLGYVFATSLTPLIDGEIPSPLKGRIDLSSAEKPDCSYELSYQGRTSEEDIVFVSSDYIAQFNCRQNFEMFRFNANIYMAEIPYDLGTKPIFQIVLDLPEISAGYENFLSIITEFDALDKKVNLEQVSLKKFKENQTLSELPAESPIDALKAALEIQLNALNKQAWKIISNKMDQEERPQ